MAQQRHTDATDDRLTRVAAMVRDAVKLLNQAMDEIKGGGGGDDGDAPSAPEPEPGQPR